MRAGVKYESGKGFLITPEADIERVKHIISGALRGAPVEIIHECWFCGKEITCRECEYYPVCSIEEASPPCICRECLDKITLEDYAKAWASKHKIEQ